MSRHQIRFACLFASAAIAAPSLTIAPSAFAQNAAIDLPPIVVSSDHVPLERERVGASVTVITGQELREKNLTTVADALRSVPGVEVDSSGGRASLTAVRIRGGESRHVMVIIDGIEANQLGFPGFDFADLMTDAIERIEIIRGPQSGIYGASAQAGVISITTENGKGVKPGAHARIEGGTQSTVTGSGGVRGQNGPFYGAVNVSSYSTGGYNFSRAGNEKDGSRATIATTTLGVDLTPNFNIEGVARLTDRSTDIDEPSFINGLLTDANDVNKYKNFAGRLGATFKAFDGHWVQSINAKVFHEETSSFANGIFSFGAEGTRSDIEYKSTMNAVSNFLGGEKHTFVFLLNHRQEDYKPSGATTYEKRRESIAGEYILDLPTATTLSAALRQDWNSAFDDAFTWRLAMSQRFPAWGTRLHASIGTGVTDPDVYALFGRPDFFIAANPNLVPESSTGWDAGVEQSFFANRMLIDVTYFSSDFTDKIEPNFALNPGFTTYVNGAGKAIRRGVEFAQTVQWADWFSTRATYTYTHALDSNGLQEIRRPPNAASLEATARLFDGRTKASARVSYGEQRDDRYFNGVTTATVTLPSVTLVRATVSHDVTPWATAYVRAENIFNRQYEEVFSYRQPGFAAFVGLKVRTPD